MAVPDAGHWADAFACGQAAASHAVRWPAGPATGEQADAASDGGYVVAGCEVVEYGLLPSHGPNQPYGD